MTIFIQQIINGLTIGGIYALVAIGYTMVYGILKFVNFAHGDLVIFSIFAFLMLFSIFGGLQLPSMLIFVCVLLSTLILIMLLGITIERVAYKPLRNAPRLSAVVSALGVSMILENSMMLIWSPNVKSVAVNIIPNTNFFIGGIYISFIQMLILITSFILMFITYFFIEKTKIGIAIRATSMDIDAARLMGVNVNQIIRVVFGVGAILGAIGGILIGLNYRQVYFNMGWMYGINAFIAAVIGGIGNIPGAMIGGILLGLFNSLIAGYISVTWAQTFVYLLLIIILIFMPTGILKERIAEKV
jgi:branched-chain amino acid transport system permease protein